MDNHTLAQMLRQRARLVEAEGGNLYRVRAYRRAAQAVLEADEPIEAVWQRGGRCELRQLTGIGPRLAATIENLLQSKTTNPTKHTNKTQHDNPSCVLFV